MFLHENTRTLIAHEFFFVNKDWKLFILFSHVGTLMAGLVQLCWIFYSNLDKNIAFCLYEYVHVLCVQAHAKMFFHNIHMSLFLEGITSLTSCLNVLLQYWHDHGFSLVWILILKCFWTILTRKWFSVEIIVQFPDFTFGRHMSSSISRSLLSTKLFPQHFYGYLEGIQTRGLFGFINTIIIDSILGSIFWFRCNIWADNCW